MSLISRRPVITSTLALTSRLVIGGWSPIACRTSYNKNSTLAAPKLTVDITTAVQIPDSNDESQLP